jgi:hypothetical protein
MPFDTSTILLFVAVLLANFIIIYTRYKRNQNTKKKSWTAIERMENGDITPEQYGNTLKTLVISAQIPANQIVNFQALHTINKTTVNKIYIIKEVYEINKNKWLVIADILCLENFIGKSYSESFRDVDDKLYTGHVLIDYNNKTKNCGMLFNLPRE